MTFERILALDTATETVSVALLDGPRRFYQSDAQYNRHSEQILPFVDTVLKESGLTLKDIDAIAFGAGPGAFTGLRVACGVAQGLGWASEKPLVAVSNLEAAAIKRAFTGRILVALDARMKECYVAAYEVTGGCLSKSLSEPVVAKPEDLGALCEKFEINDVSGDAFKRYADRIDLTDRVQVLEKTPATALEIAFLAQSMAQEGKTVTALNAAPIYVRNRVALTIDERAQGVKL